MTHCGQSCVEMQFIMNTSRKSNASPSSNSITPTETLKQAPTKPNSGRRPEIKMLISFGGKKKILARVLLDSGCTTHIASEKLFTEHHVQFGTRKEH